MMQDSGIVCIWTDQLSNTTPATCDGQVLNLPGLNLLILKVDIIEVPISSIYSDD